MATALVSPLGGNIYNTALIRAWGDSMADAFDALGMVRTADTGQVDWATVVGSGGSNQELGYEVRQFADDLQDTDPLFMRIRYRVGFGNGTDRGDPQMYVTLGRGTNGAGVITGAKLGEMALADNTSAHGGEARLCLTDDGVFVFLHGTSVTNNWILVIEREHDPDGGVSPGGEVFCWKFSASQNSTNYQALLPFGADGAWQRGPNNQGDRFLFQPDRSLARGADDGLIPGIWKWAGAHAALGAMSYWHNDIAAGAPIVVPRAGVNRTYFPLGQVLHTEAFLNNNSPQNPGFAMIWE